MFAPLRARISRHVFNCFPAYRATGGQITYIAPDWQEVRIELPSNWRTRNYVGTTYGGSIYGTVDPIYMMMLIRTLGEEYVVWDKEVEIRFKKSGRDILYATFRASNEELDAIRAELVRGDSIDRVYTVALVDEEGVTHATVRKTLHVTIDQEKAA